MVCGSTSVTCPQKSRPRGTLPGAPASGWREWGGGHDCGAGASRCRTTETRPAHLVGGDANHLNKRRGRGREAWGVGPGEESWGGEEGAGAERSGGQRDLGAGRSGGQRNLGGREIWGAGRSWGVGRSGGQTECLVQLTPLEVELFTKTFPSARWVSAAGPPSSRSRVGVSPGPSSPLAPTHVATPPGLDGPGRGGSPTGVSPAAPGRRRMSAAFSPNGNGEVVCMNPGSKRWFKVGKECSTGRDPALPERGSRVAVRKVAARPRC